MTSIPAKSLLKITTCVGKEVERFTCFSYSHSDFGFIFGSPFKDDISLGYKLYKKRDYNLNGYIRLKGYGYTYLL